MSLLLRVVVLISLTCAATAGRADGLSLLRDAEIENTIRAYTTPVFQAAGLEPSAVDIYIVNDKTLNAFVAGGQNLFINAGLLMAADTPEQVIGVVAHETGHIAGGHLSRTQEALSHSSAQTILSYVLGGAAALATGRADVGQAVIMGGQQMGVRSFLAYSRTQEGAADQAALHYLETAGVSARGLLEFFEKLGDQELLSISRQDPYVRTHPLTRERVDGIRDYVSHSPLADRRVSAELIEAHGRMRAKLYAFMEPGIYTLRRYAEDDPSIEARYARAIAYYRRPELDKALPLIDGLIAERPKDPYFHELRGQVLFENGQAAAALPSYETAVQLRPESALLRRDLARVQLDSGDDGRLDAAIVNLRAALQREPREPSTWRLLATAYGRQGDMGMSALALAEEAMLQGKKPDATFYAERAVKTLPEGSAARLQAQDILQALKADEPDGEERRKPR